MRALLTRMRPSSLMMGRRLLSGHSPFTTPGDIAISLIKPSGEKVTLMAHETETILQLAHREGVDMEGACDGCMACSTCHVYLDKAWFKKLGEVSDKENDLLDLAPGVSDTSRLGCQVIVRKEMHGNMTVTLPKNTVNFYVDGHVPKPH